MMGILSNLGKWLKQEESAAPASGAPDTNQESAPTPVKKNKWGIVLTGASPVLDAHPPATSQPTHGGMLQPKSTPKPLPAGKGLSAWEKQQAAIAAMEAEMEEQETQIPSCPKCEQGIVPPKISEGKNPLDKGATLGANRIQYCNCPGGKIARGDTWKYQE